MEIDIYRKITRNLNKKRRIIRWYFDIELVTSQEIIDLLIYLESLNEIIEYIEEVPTKELNFE